MLSVIVEELGFGREQRRERPMSIHIPYLRHVSDTVIGLESGAILSIVRLDGLFFQTEDQAEINMRAAVQNTMIRALGSSRYSLWSTVIRKEAKPTLGGNFSDFFFATFWAQLPGNHAYIARSCMLSSANFSGFSSLHNFATGRASGLHWGLPISILETTSQTPYWFNFHQRDIGHFLVTGPTGSGKTVALTFVLAQAFRISPEPRAVFFDKDRGAEIFIRAVGGDYEVLQPGVATGFNPLQLENNPVNREFLIRLMKSMLSPADGGGFSQEEEDTLERAIPRICQEPVAQRTLANLSGLLMGRARSSKNDLQARLRQWFEGEKAWLFNVPHDVLSFSDRRTFGFDMTHILDNQNVRTPALMYLYHRLDELLTGEPVLIFMDEDWKLLQDPEFSNYIVDKMKTIRKLNGVVGFGTQSAADIARAPQSHTLIEQSATNLHFRCSEQSRPMEPQGRRDDACDGDPRRTGYGQG